MNFLDLVRPSAKDLGSGQRIARRYVEALSASTATALVQVESSVCPSDLVRVIHTITLNTVGGAAQTNLFNQIFHKDIAAGFVLAQLGMQFDLAPVAAGTNTKSLVGLEIAVMQGETISFGSTFSGGVAANAISAYLIGWEFPRGNLQR